MTTLQQKAINRIRELAKATFYSEGKYEFKEFEVTEFEHFVSVYVVTGMKGDEGTLAAVFARDRAHFFVGPKGSISYPVTSKRTRQQVRRRFTAYNNFLTVVCAQQGEG